MSGENIDLDLHSEETNLLEPLGRPKHDNIVQISIFIMWQEQWFQFATAVTVKAQ